MTAIVQHQIPQRDFLTNITPELNIKRPKTTIAEAPTSPETKTSLEYQILEEPLQSGKQIKIINIGAGASGLNFAHDVSNSKLNLALTIYDKNPEIGGTWYENRYPGCACDIPSVNYQFSWAPSPSWTSYYSSAPEILAYFKKVAVDYDLLKYVKLSHTVVGAWWEDDKSQWRVRVQRGADPEDTFDDFCNILINATGVLNKWKWPAIEDRERFQGKMLHSAAWDESVSLEGKTVALIGNGSSAIQIVPNILSTVKQLKCFVRSPSWVTAGFAQKFAGPNGQNFKYNERQHEIMMRDPVKYLKYRKNIESELSSRFRFILNGSAEQASAMKFSTDDMRSRLANRPEIADKIIPKDFPVGCRRPTPGNGYLEALCDPKVQTTYGDIVRFTERGLMTADGVEHNADVIICATGFDVSWKPYYPTIGRNGRNLAEEWKTAPSTYLSVTVPHFPNYLIFNGPFGPYGHGSFLCITETLSRYVHQILKKFSDERLTSFEPTEEAVAEFANHRRKFLTRTAWNAPCSSWFKQGSKTGEIMMWPGSRIHFFETMANVRWEDYKLTRENANRFNYLGNGFAARESDGRDLSWYMGLLDDRDEQPEFSDEDVKDFLMA